MPSALKDTRFATKSMTHISRANVFLDPNVPGRSTEIKSATMVSRILHLPFHSDLVSGFECVVSGNPDDRWSIYVGGRGHIEAVTSNVSTSNVSTSNVSRCHSELPANVSLPGIQNCCPKGMTTRDEDGVGCEGEINGANRTCAIYDTDPAQDRCFLTSLNATDPAKQTHPCVLADFIASLSPGDGYYFNPTIIGGW